MAYSKQTWSSNELITADKLNHIEDGIPTKTSQLTNDSGFLTSHQSIDGKKNTQSAVSSPNASGTAVAFIDSISQDTQGVITPTKKTVASASQSASGLMSAADKTKLDGIAAGAQVNSITGVKGNAESSYHQGNVNLTPENIGAVAVGDGSTNASINQEVINSARSFVLHSYGGTYPHVGAIFKETGLQLWDYTNDGSELWWFPKVIGIPQGGTGATTPANARANLEITPANIGAVNKAGDTMTGDLNFAHSNMLVYGAEDTRRWLLYPNGNKTEFYCATQEKINGEWATWTDVWRAHSDGTLELDQPLGVTYGGTGATNAAGARTNLGITPENIGAFKQIPGYVTREMLNDYNIKYWYGGRVLAPDAVAIGLPSHEWFVLNMSKDDDPDSSWTRQVFYQLGGPLIFERTCSYHTWSSPAMVSVPVSLNLHDGSREIVLVEISKVEPGYTAPIFITNTGCSHLTGGHLSLYLTGTIARSSPTSVVIMAAEMTPATAIYTWRIDNLLDPNNWTFGAITKYTGTVI